MSKVIDFDMYIMNSKERKARDRGRKQGYQMCLDELRDYFMLGQAQIDNPDLKKKDVIKVLQHLEKMEKENK